MMDIVKWLRELKMSAGNADWNANIVNNKINEAADEIERLREALRLERKLRDSALSLANDLQNELNRMNGHTWSVVAALKEKE